MIEAHGLVKRYGSTMAVNDLSFSIRPGLVTGFLGPNGAGKTTTMRMILGLDAPTQGSVTVGGRSYRDLPAPMREVGALLDAKALHGGRRARDHLLCLAQSNGIPRSRVDEVLRIVGLAGRGQAPGEGLLAGHGSAARHRLGAPRGPGRAHLRRTGERPGPRRHPLGPDPHADAGRRGPHRAGLQPPDERDGPDRRPPAGDRQGPADRRYRRGRVRAVQFPAVGTRPQPPGGRAGRRPWHRPVRAAR